MRIRTHIFSWIFLATVVPLTAVALAAIYFIERDYEQRVHNEINSSLGTIVSDVRRHVEAQRDLALGLANANVVQEFLPQLQAAQRGELDPRMNVSYSRINHYFEGFQTIINGLYIMRLMDRRGNTYIKVSDKRRSAPVYESISGQYFVEQEIVDQEFRQALKQLPASAVSNLILPHNELTSEQMAILPQYDYLVPLYSKQTLVGALSLSLFGEQIDRVIDHAPRLYTAQVFIVENNPDIPERHGLVLYDDEHGMQMNQVREEYLRMPQLYGDAMFNQIIRRPYGVYVDKQADESIFYQELFPYEGQLVSWVIGVRVKNQYIIEPFVRARWIVLSVAGMALLVSLLLSNIGVHTIAKPVRNLASQLLAYAQGKHEERVQTDSGIDEIRDLELAFNTMADSLDTASDERDTAQHMMLQSAKLASLGQLAAGIGHEINNPLNNIISYAKLIERALPEDQTALRQDLQSLKSEALRAGNIVQGILNFARQVPPHYAPFEVLTWLQDTFALVRQSAIDAGITLAYECPENFIIEGDRRQLQQALINLLLNAIAASARHGQILLRATSNEEHVRLDVTDQGSGIAQEILDNVFDPFFTTKREGEGSGLGLSISLGIIEQHGGTLTIQNNLDIGVTATIILPRKQHHE